jgi:NADPH:quinone reductase
VRAALIQEVGGAPEVVEVPAPTRGRGEALVRVAASALQPVDLIVASGRFYDGPPEVPFTPGLEAIGTIEEAETLSPGTRVRVEIVHPGYGVDAACSEYVVVSETPTGDGGRRQTALQVIDHAELSDDLLAALGSSGGTAWRLLETAAAAGRPAEGARPLERMEASEAIFAEAAAGRVEVAYEVVALDDIADAWRRQAGSPGCKLVIRP